MTIDNLYHNMTSLQILVGKNKGSAQNRSRFCTWTLPCHPCRDSSVMPSAINIGVFLRSCTKCKCDLL